MLALSGSEQLAMLYAFVSSVSLSLLLASPNAIIRSYSSKLYIFHPLSQNLAKDYWSSMFFLKFQEECDMRCNGYELEQMTGWNYSPRLSSVHGTDDPFHQQDHLLKNSECGNDTDS
jgi:hypothetical protein